MARVPLIHINGSDPMALRDSYARVGQAILDLARAIDESAPNARDYYPMGDGVYEHARNEHYVQLAQLDKLRIHYLELLQGIQAQIDERETRLLRKVPR